MSTDADQPAGNLDPKPATSHTRDRNRGAVINFDDETDFAHAQRGLIAQHDTGRIEIDGRLVWDTARHDFLRADGEVPETVHPGLWRQGKLNAIHGLFEVADGVWQARGYDISNITFMAADDGWLIIDPLTTEQTAAACLQLANDTLGERPVSSIIYTHSHPDHFGGVNGVTTEEAVAAGDVRIIAPEGFLHEVVGEVVLAGPIMARRAVFQFGPLLPSGPRGQVDNGLGKGLPLGQSGLIAPTEIVSETGAELNVGGIRIVFQNTPDAEAPAEMNFFFPDKHLLCMAENCSHNLHNLYPIRGAQTRDALAWSKYLQEALLLWGDQTETMFASHHWPRFGNGDVREFISMQRDVYRWMHDQTLRLANTGHTPDEISEELSMPDGFAGQSHVQGYYGTVSHNVRSVYNRYLGWYDGNPAHLHPHPPVEAGRRYVKMMGGPDAVMRGAQEAFGEGDYRWVVEVLNHLVFADPTHRGARELAADAMEQLGYQSESGTWRNAYLCGASELRNGSLQLGPARPRQVAHAITGEQLIDMIGVRFNPARFRADARILWRFSDLDEAHLMGVRNATIHHEPSTMEVDPATATDASGASFDLAVTLDRRALVEAMGGGDRLQALMADGRIAVDHGDATMLSELIGALDIFMTPALIEP